MTVSLRPLFLLTTALSAFSAGAWAETLDSELDIPSLAPKLEKRAEPDALVRATIGGQAGGYYKDNIYRSDNNKVSDYVGYIAPGFRITTDAPDYAATVTGMVEGGAFADNSNNNYVDADLRARGSYNLSQDTALLAEGRVRRDHIEIGAFADDPEQLADKPTIYYYQDASAGIKSFVDENDRVMLLADSQIRNYNYLNVDRVGGGRIIQDDRDRTEYYQRARAGYVLAPGLMPYVEGIYNVHNYQKDVDQNLIHKRDSDGFAAMAGLEYTTLENTLTFDGAAGYLDQNYDSAILPDVNTWGARGDLQWQASPRTLLFAGFDRSIQEAVVLGTSSYIRTRVSAGGQYLLAPLWTIGADARYSLFDFQVNNGFPGALSREDDVYDTSAFVRYDVNDIYNVGLEYLYSNRDSNINQFDFTANTFLVRLAANY
jgi:hypothetical protein